MSFEINIPSVEEQAFTCETEASCQTPGPDLLHWKSPNSWSVTQDSHIF